ncbi:hypothetical protein HSX37_06025|uniref:Phosphonate dehydrogenase n=1 Tax=Dendrosporobacter quercicolus TaxID=146817 RepID=A0A1G9YBQ6_9FIRM|nr:NAD(P)-dependent oxidoreductase [Dendrosporobacter quercicolus]NSL47600.1 hypothetical protein [Dendrosporobacter quercicolus DSM 1736]SDN06470.1 phosphonate dehydrogenase [Dendrosporobacter quercicolus]
MHQVKAGTPKPMIYYTHQVPAEGPRLLRPYFKVIVNSSPQPPDLAQILAAARDAYGLCISVRDYIDEWLLAQMPKLRIIASFGRGSDNVDSEAAARKGIVVAQNDGAIMSEPVADLAWSLLLGLARKIVSGDQAVRSGLFSGWSPSPHYGLGVSGKSLGIIGMGQLGKAVASRAAGFKLRLYYAQPDRLPSGQESLLGLTHLSLQALLREADFICVCCPLTKGTVHLIGSKELRMMKPAAILVNPSRGSVVDEEAVVAALANNRIGGYGADVFEMEDYCPGKHSAAISPQLLKMQDRTLFAPHAGTAIAETRVLMAQKQAEAVLNGYCRLNPGSN